MPEPASAPSVVVGTTDAFFTASHRGKIDLPDQLTMGLPRTSRQGPRHPGPLPVIVSVCKTPGLLQTDSR
jgi:hypothetical protein